MTSPLVTMSFARPVGSWPRMAVARSIAEPLMAAAAVGLALALSSCRFLRTGENARSPMTATSSTVTRM